MTKVIASATLADAQVCNDLDPPTRGCDAGGGIHVVIPDNYADLISQGVDVPGCTYASVQADGSLIVSAAVQAAIVVPANVTTISAANVADLTTKLVTAVAAQVAVQEVLT